MRIKFYYWFVKLADKMYMHYEKELIKWGNRHKKWLDKWEAEYSTGGSMK